MRRSTDVQPVLPDWVHCGPDRHPAASGAVLMDELLTREDVEEAMAYLGMIDPKASQNIPLHETIVGHLIVATARKLRHLEQLAH
jgi:hypothetical protein